MGTGNWGTALFATGIQGVATVEEGRIDDDDASSISSSEFSAGDSLLAGAEAPVAPAPERALIYNDFHQPHRHHHQHQHHTETDADDRADLSAESSAGALSSYRYALPVAMRTSVPIVAAALSLQFRSFTDMVVCIGGVCGGAVSIVIPCLVYYNIHYQEMRAAEKCVVVGTAVLGAVLVLSTLVMFTI
jgi:hypothetical protein